MLVPSGNPEKLADAILFLKNEPVNRKQISEEGYKTYNEYLSMNETGKKLVFFMQELIGKKN